MDNPITLKTRKAMGVLGLLMREWTLDPASRPPHIEEAERRCVIAIEDFRMALRDRGLSEETAANPQGDYAVRAGIAEVELILRSPDRFSILLPEAEMIQHLEEEANAGRSLHVRMARFYAGAGPAVADLVTTNDQPAVNDAGPAAVDVKLGIKPFETFLDPYIAAYSCTQCM